MLAKIEKEVLISIVTTTPSFVPIGVDHALNVPSADTGTISPKMGVSTIEVSLMVIVAVSLLKVTISTATLKPFEDTPIDLRVLTNVFPIIPIVDAVLVISTQKPIQTSPNAQT